MHQFFLDEFEVLEERKFSLLDFDLAGFGEVPLALFESLARAVRLAQVKCEEVVLQLEVESVRQELLRLGRALTWQLQLHERCKRLAWQKRHRVDRVRRDLEEV